VSKLTWLFDLDNTLHNANRGVFPVMHASMNRYMAHLLGDGIQPADEALVNATRLTYLKKYGATVLGLIAHHRIDPNDFLSQTHRFENLPQLLKFESGLRQLLKSLPGRKILLTNGAHSYAKDVTRCIGVHRHFHHHIAIEAMWVHRRLRPKPNKTLFRKLLARHRLRPQQCVLVEDTVSNLRAAKQLGVKTVWVTQYSNKARSFKRSRFIDVKVRSVKQLPAKLSRLKNG
jgi:putative hydrolase of the HAD superfamily